MTTLTEKIAAIEALEVDLEDLADAARSLIELCEDTTTLDSLWYKNLTSRKNTLLDVIVEVFGPDIDVLAEPAVIPPKTAMSTAVPISDQRPELVATPGEFCVGDIVKLADRLGNLTGVPLIYSLSAFRITSVDNIKGNGGWMSPVGNPASRFRWNDKWIQHD